MGLGERVQIDHMSATKNGVGVKHFMAQDRMADRNVKTHPRADIFQRQGHIRPKILARVRANRPV